MSVSIDDRPLPKINPNILMEILGANETVRARVEAFAQAKSEAEEAFAKLLIGKDAQKAYEDASAKYAESQEQSEKAAKAADEAVQKAKSAAASILQDAEEQRTKAMGEVALAKKELEEASALFEKEMQAAKKDLKDRLAAVEAREAAADRALADAAKAVRDADLSRAEADAAAESFKSHAAKLQQAVSSMGLEVKAVEPEEKPGLVEVEASKDAGKPE